MDKKEFLHKLQKGLSGLPKDDIQERLNFYSEMIDDSVEEGLTEEDAISRIGSVLRVKINTQKVDDNPANTAMKVFLAEFFDVPQSSIILVKGAKGKEKTVEVRDKSEEELRQIMDAIP